MSTRPEFIRATTAALAGVSLASRAQQPGKVYRIGYLSQPTRESVAQAGAAFLN